MLLRGLYQLLSMTGVPRLVFRLMLDRRVPLRVKLILPAALAYLISPLDLLRDFVPVVGRLDDLIVIVLSIALFLVLAPRDVVAEHIRGARPDGDQDRRPQDRDKVIDGSFRHLDDDQEKRS